MATQAEQAAQEQVAERTRIYLRPLAGPLSLGLLRPRRGDLRRLRAQPRLGRATEGKKVALCVIAFTVPLQFTASICRLPRPRRRRRDGMGVL